MHNAADNGVSALPEHHGDSFCSIVSELAALLDHVQRSIKAIEIAIARDASSKSSEHVDDVVVLDDVTPRYAKASAALNTCNASLDAALQFSSRRQDVSTADQIRAQAGRAVGLIRGKACPIRADADFFIMLKQQRWRATRSSP